MTRWSLLLQTPSSSYTTSWDSTLLVPEAFTLGIKSGVDTRTLFDAISRGSGDTWTMHEFPNYLFKGDFEPRFQLDLAVKDMGLATEMGRKLSVPMELANLVQQRYIEAQNRGWAGWVTPPLPASKRSGPASRSDLTHQTQRREWRKRFPTSCAHDGTIARDAR